MRRLLGAMRSDGDDAERSPQPGLDRLDSLIEEIGRAGLPVRLQVEGERFALPAAIDLSAYRIVQEGLTNALKHAQRQPARTSSSATRADERADRGARRRRRRAEPATGSATASSASASGSRSTAAR